MLRCSVLAVVAAGFSAGAVFTAPALASSAGRADAATRVSAALRSAPANVPTKKSTTFAGYGINSSKKGATTVTASLIVPKVKGCTKTDKGIAPSAGMDVKGKTIYSDVDLFVGCENGKATFFPALTVNGNETNYTTVAVHPGDEVVLTTTVTSTSTKVTFFDKTTKVNKTERSTGETTGVHYLWVGEVDWSFAPIAIAAVPDFGNINFSGAKVGGEALGSFAKRHLLYRYNRYAAGKATLQIKTGSVARNEESFATDFKHS